MGENENDFIVLVGSLFNFSFFKNSPLNFTRIVKEIPCRKFERIEFLVDNYFFCLVF